MTAGDAGKVTIFLSANFIGESRYHLDGDLDEARARLPFPDPLLTVGEARQLAKGRTAAHRWLQQLLARRLS